MADHGSLVAITLPDFTVLGEYALSPVSMAHGAIETLSLAPLPVVSEYGLTGTLQPDAGNPPPTRGQIWPRGNITQS
jgi:hypothetical protein